MVSKALKLDADEAIKRKGEFGTADDKLLDEIQEMQDERFTDIRSIRFGWVDQPSGVDGKIEKKLMSIIPSGKFVFPDRSQDLSAIVPEDPYLCLVFEPPDGKVAFAKILFPEYQPKIYVPPSRIPAMVWRDEKGRIHTKVQKYSSYEERLLASIKDFEKMGMESIKVVFRKNEK